VHACHGSAADDVQVGVTIEKAIQFEALYNRPQHVALEDFTYETRRRSRACAASVPDADPATTCETDNNAPLKDAYPV